MPPAREATMPLNQSPPAEQDRLIRTDPSILTTQQLQREMTSVRELYDTRFECVTETSHLAQKVIETRIGGMDEAIGLVREATNRLPMAIAEKISALEKIHEEKFSSIQTQFHERDVRTDQTSRDSKVAVDAALKAQQEAFSEQNKSSALAIAKSEFGTSKQIEQIADLLRVGIKMLDDKISDLKERLTRVEGKNPGTVAIIVSALAGVGSVAAVVIALVVRH